MRSIPVLTLLLLTAGCPERSAIRGGDDDDDGTVIDAAPMGPFDAAQAPCLPVYPSGSMTKTSSEYPIIGPGCEVVFGTALDPMPVTAHVHDFQTNDPLSGATMAFFLDGDLGVPDLTATSDLSGQFSVVFPAMSGANGYIARTSASDALDTYEWFAEPGADRVSFSIPTSNAMPAFVGVARTPGTGMIVGEVRDCGRFPVEHAIAVLSLTPDPTCPWNPVPGAQTFYFAGVDADPDMPVRHSVQAETNDDGKFLFIEVPPTAPGETYTIQIWGWVTPEDVARGDAGLQLVSLVHRPVLADSVELVTVYTTGLETPGP